MNMEGMSKIRLYSIIIRLVYIKGWMKVSVYTLFERRCISGCN